MNLAQRLEKCYSGSVYDVLRAMGHADCILPHNIRPLDTTQRLAGPIFTVEGERDALISDHDSLLAWTGLLSEAPAGHVVVCQPNDDQMAFMGELSAETMLLRKVRGYVVDGGCRDTDFILRIGFKVFCTHFTPRDVVGQWKPRAFGQPIVIGGVSIHTGDYLVADRDGVVIIPAALAQTVTEQSEKVIRTESLVRKAILQGVDPQEAYLKHGKF